MALQRPQDMPLDWNALMNDEKVLRMNNEQLGMYMRLLHRAWFADVPASLPVDDLMLASITQVSVDRWTEVKTVVMAPFFIRAGRYYQKKMLEVYNAVIRKLERLQESGRSGAEKRWNNNRLDRVAIATPLGLPCQTQKGRDSNLIELNRIESTDKADKACRRGGGRLEGRHKEIADTAEALLGADWVNDAGKWVKRIRKNLSKCERVFAEVKAADREGRIRESAAQFAEDTWKRFQ